MATREFRDNSARAWTVWAVRPTGGSATGRRTPLQAEFAAGWLTCETEGEKRRIAPIPKGWETMSDAELAALCAGGTVVRPIRRRAPDNGRADPRWP